MEKRRLVLEGATILTGPEWRPQAGSAVLIDGERITAISSVGESGVPKDARTFDCSGMYMLPGFIDMHTHCHTRQAVDFLAQFGPRMDEPAYREWFLKLFVAYGVTTVRDVGNFVEVFDLRREFKDSAAAPSMAVAGELLEGSEPLWPLGRKVPDAQTALEEVRRQKVLGAEWVKLYVGIDNASAKAAIDEAHKLGLRVAGHIWKTTAREAALMDVDTLEHTTTLAEESFLSDEDRTSLPGTDDGRYRPERSRQVWARSDLDSNAARDLVRVLMGARTAVCPTLVVHENTMKGPHPSYRNFAFDYVPQQWLETWEGRLKTFQPVGEHVPDPDAAFSKAISLVSRLSSSGVFIIGGTDAALWNPYVVPGASIHRELELLSEAGMKPEEALSSVTCLAAERLGQEGEIGAVRVGMRANLVLLGSNPVADVRNTRDTKLVINKGHAFSPEDLLENIEPID